MSNYIGWAIHPKTKKVEQASFLDDYFGHHRYAVKFENDTTYYHEEEIKIPTDFQVTESDSYKEFKKKEKLNVPTQ